MASSREGYNTGTTIIATNKLRDGKLLIMAELMHADV
jgi:hypothetical protein